MKLSSIFRFIVNKEDHAITVERSFNAPLDPIWAAWTEADILCQWWAPKPYECVITGLDFREGGRWSYYMQDPEGERHHCFFDYTTVKLKTLFSGNDGFCDERGVINTEMPRMKWTSTFSESDGRAVVNIRIDFDSAEDLEKIITIGFKEGFTMGLDQLDQLLAGS